MQKVYVFDFDGTLTTRDSFISIIRYSKGNMKCFLGLLRFSPLLVLMKLHLYPNYKAKQKVFSHFFKGWNIDDFNDMCIDFAFEYKHILRIKGIMELYKAMTSGSKVLIVSASIDNWVIPFFYDDGVYDYNEDGPVQVLGTKIEVKDDLITGRFLTPNCYGKEKVNRIKGVLPDRSSYELIAYGDSRGDREMLKYADKGYYKPFR